MTRSQVAALTIALLAVAGVAGGAAWWIRVHREMSVLAERSAPLQPSVSAQLSAAPETADRETPSKAEAVAPSPSKPSMRPPPAQPDTQPSFDVVRVEPRGDTVVAGKGAANADIALMSGGKVVGEAKSDANGQFVILPPPLRPGDYDLTLRQRPDNGKPASESAQSVAVSVPKPGKGSVVVALAEPGKATKLLSAPPQATPPDAAAPQAVTPQAVTPQATTSSSPAASAAAPTVPVGKVVIHSAELENGTGFFVSGAATPGASVHVYLNDAHIADVVAGKDGGWSVRVKKGLTGGHYTVRADVGNGSGHAVVSRAEVPFDVPMAMAAAPPPAKVASAAPIANPTTTPSPPAAPATTAAPDTITAPSTAAVSDTATGSGTTTFNGEAVLDSVATARVTSGDNLWNISRFRLGDGKRYTQIYAANADQIRDPNLIYPGQVFVVPRR